MTHSFPTRRSSDLPAAPPTAGSSGRTRRGRRLGSASRRNAARRMGRAAGETHRTGVGVAKGNWMTDQVNDDFGVGRGLERSEEHTSELQSLMRISYAVFCLKKKKKL